MDRYGPGMSDDRDPGSAPEPVVEPGTFGLDRDDRVHAFAAPGVTVTWSKRRCTHAATCVMNLPDVFAPGRRPWVDASQAAADSIARVVARCPTGALHFTRTDGGAAETVPDTNLVVVTRDGPIHVRGELEILDESGATRLHETRVALCRCGRSTNRPLCNNAHLVTGFRDAGVLRSAGTVSEPDTASRALRIATEPGGPLRLEGPFVLAGADGGTILAGTRATLCRCGRSQNKPFCDGSHQVDGARGSAPAS
jgi:CDGSH-type Zn-finger protein/uncharacterized Fe-S cluster protein YjdI